MAFRGRGGGVHSRGGRRGHHRRIHRIHHANDSLYWALEAIIVFSMIIALIANYLFSHKSIIEDPIRIIKNLWIDSYLIILGILLFFIIRFHIKITDKRQLLNRITIILAISIITILTFSFIKFVKMDYIYTREKFIELYQLSGSNIPRGAYLKECRNLYEIFTVKTLIIIVLNALFILFLLYQTLKLLKLKKKLDRLEKDDIVVYDEEQNITI